jgi:serine/threonine-protein kinase SRPK3
MDQPLYISPVDAEPLDRYRQGGYHPVVLGEHLKAGRYKVLHKLGWGGYSTVWAARDQRLYKIMRLMVILANIKFYLIAGKRFMLLSRFLLQKRNMMGKRESSKL